MSAMAVNKVVYGTTVLVDLTKDTVTADKLLKGATAHDASGGQITGTMEPGIDTSDATATSDDIALRKTAYVDGKKVVGTVVDYESGVSAGWTKKTPIVDSSGDIGFKVEISESKYTGRLYRNGSKVFIMSDPSSFGDATTEDVVSGKTFTSAAGLKVTGTHKCTGGGSSDNNCEAYHITSASATLNFKTTGTVKVWGYGTATSGYQTHMYAFVGDGYYRSASWGSPTKTSATFSINADGTLHGLPNMSACDLLVTIGV